MQCSEGIIEGVGVSRKKILIVEDHPIVRKGFSMLIDQEEDMETAGEAGSYSEAVSLVRSSDADLVLLDLSLKDGNGLELLKEFKSFKPDLPVLVVSLHDENTYAQRVLKAGARGYVMKSEATDNILKAIRTIIGGGVYLSQNVKDKLIYGMAGGSEYSSPTDVLSDRELEVFQLIGEGKGTRDIADILFLSVKTIETYKSHIKMKLDIRDSTELIRRAVEWKVSGS